MDLSQLPARERILVTAHALFYRDGIRATGVDRLIAESGDVRLRKATPDSFNQTELQALLNERRIDALVICGMHTEFCVDTTCRRAMALGWPVWLAADAHTSAGNAALTPQQVIAHHNATLANISSFGPRTRAVPTDVLIQDGRLALA